MNCVRFPALLILAAFAFCTAGKAQSYTFSNTSHYGAGNGLVVDKDGTRFISQRWRHQIGSLGTDGTFKALAGGSAAGAVDGTGPAALFREPQGLATDAAGNLYVADTGNHIIRKVTPAGAVTTLAGALDGGEGSVDGTGSAARFRSPVALAVDASGNVYVADRGNHSVRKISPSGVVTTLAGSAGQAGAVDGAGTAARFNAPQSVAVDSSGNVYVAESLNRAVRKITPAGMVTTYAGSLGNAGMLDATGNEARFVAPTAIATDAAGNLFVADDWGSVRKVGPDRSVKTLGNASYSQIIAIVPDSKGTLHILSEYYAGHFIGVPSGEVTITVQPESRTVAAGSSFTLRVTATGEEPLSYQWQRDGVPIAGATRSTLVFAGARANDSGSYTVSVTNAVGTKLSEVGKLLVTSALANDSFANAEMISGATVSIAASNEGATPEPDEPTHYAYDATRTSVWYEWKAPATGRVVIRATRFDHGVAYAAYEGSSLGSLTKLGEASYGAQLLFDATAGTTYSIAFGSVHAPAAKGESFAFELTLVSNDNFADALVLSGDSGEVSVVSRAGTLEPGEPVHSHEYGQLPGSLWYTWTPTQSGAARLSTTDWLTLQVYTGSSLHDLQEVRGIKSPGNLAFTASAGQTYYIAAFSYHAVVHFRWEISPAPIAGAVSASVSDPQRVHAGMPFSLSIPVVGTAPLTYQWRLNGTSIPGATNASYEVGSAAAAHAGDYDVIVTNSGGSTTSAALKVAIIVPPSNDAFENAQPISTATGSAAGNNEFASGQPGEPIHWNVYGTGTSLWYKWTAPVTGLAIIDTAGSTIDTVLAVYTGSTLETLTRLVQDDDRGGRNAARVSFSAVAGTTYSIALGSAYQHSRGATKLNWQLEARLAIVTPPSSQTVSAGSSATFAVGATGEAATYQWYRNGTAIPGATGSSLTLGSINAGDDASYTVSVTNASGTVTSEPATLAVAAPQLTTLSVRHSEPGAGMLWSVAGGEDTLVAVGERGTILSSSDGDSWQPRYSGTENWLVGVTYGAGQFVAVGDHGLILTSRDGQTWTPVAFSGTTLRLNNVTYAAGKFVAVGEGGTILTSEDAQTWTPRFTGVAGWLHGLAYNREIGHFAASGQGGLFLYSADAVTWHVLPTDGMTEDLEAISAVSSYAQFVAIGSAGKVLAVHRNTLVLKSGEQLVTWTADLTSTRSAIRFRSLAAGAGALFASGEGGKVITATGAAGPWLTLPSGTSGNLVGGAFFDKRLYLVGENRTILQSDPLHNSRLMNISTRCGVGKDSNVLISGFVISGDAPKRVLIRAAGPALAAAPFNLAGTLAEPVLTLYDSQGKPLAQNARWSSAENSEAIATTAAAVGAFPFDATSYDSAILTTLPPGAYTAIVSGASQGTGIGLVEVYDADALETEASRAVNLSSRGVAGNGDKKLIAGFVINGASARRVLIRAVGPGISGAPFNVPGTLAEPQLELYNNRGLRYATAGEWGLQPNAEEIRGTAAALGAFALPEGSKDSAMLVTLLPGVWTVQVGGPSNTSGVVVAEIYVLP